MGRVIEFTARMEPGRTSPPMGATEPYLPTWRDVTVFVDQIVAFGPSLDSDSWTNLWLRCGRVLVVNKTYALVKEDFESLDRR